MKQALRFSMISAVVGAGVALASTVSAHEVDFKSPGQGMHFTQGQPLVVFGDITDSREGKGIIVCPAGQTISNTSPPPDYSEIGRQAQCSGGGTPTGWPAFQVLIDGVIQTDLNTNKDTVPNTTAFDHNLNPNPIGFFRFSAATSGLAAGAHQVVIRGQFSIDGINVTPQDSDPLTITLDAPPTKSVVTLSADFAGSVNWDNVIVVGNGHKVTASGSLVIKNSLVTGLGDLKTDGLSGTVTDVDIENSIFEDTGALTPTIGNGTVTIKNNEFRANNRLTFVAWDPGVPYMLDFKGSGTGQKSFQGNRVGAGKSRFGGPNWLIGGDTDDLSNVFLGPRAVVEVAGSKMILRGNYSHHNYRGAWSQGYNFYYETAGSDVLTEHNFIRDSSWPVQYLHGEFRYNVVYGYGHTWIRTTVANTIIHHNVFAAGGDGGLGAGIQCYGGENGLQIYNNTFDGGGAALGDFAGPHVDMSGGSQVVSLRNNLMTFSRNQNNDSPGGIRVIGGAAAYLSADYNAFYSPDNTNKTHYDFTGAGAHDVSGTGAIGVTDGELAANPFAGARIMADSHRIIESVIDEAAVWQGTQKVSQVLALFRDRYTPKAGSPIIDTGDPADNDAQGRRVDIGAIDLSGHDQDRLGKFGNPPSELVPPTVTLTAPAANAVLTGNATLSATAADNSGGSGVVLVQFLVDGSTVAQTSVSPYTVTFNSAILANGQHAFSAKAWDAAGNNAVSAAVTAQTQNDIPVQATGGTGAGGESSASAGTTSNGGVSTGGANNGGATAGAASNGQGSSDKGGCGCAVPGASRTQGSATLISLCAILGMALLRGRRRRRAAALGSG